MPILFIQTIWFMMNTYFPSGNPEFGYVLGRECLRDQPAIKPPRGVSNELPWLATFRSCCQEPFLGGSRCVPCDSARKGFWKLVPGFPQTLPHAPLLTVGVFAVINHSLEYNHMLSPTGFLRELLNLRVI